MNRMTHDTDSTSEMRVPSSDVGATATSSEVRAVTNTSRATATTESSFEQ